MQAIWLENQHLSYVDDAELPRPSQGEALIKVILAGICATDLELVRGYYPYAGIPGHEFVGQVVASEDPSLLGERVVGEINTACGVCENCRRGFTTHCEQRTVLGIAKRNGVFAEYACLPSANLHVVPDGIPDEAAVFTEPLAAALEIQQQVQVHPSQRVLVVGAGRLGQLIARTLALTGCDLKVVIRHNRQAELLEMVGIRSCYPEQVTERMFDLVVEATGSVSGFELARKALRPRGTMVLKSTYTGNLTANFSAVVVDEITLVGSRCGPFKPALDLLVNHRVDPTPLIQARYPLKEGLAAFAEAARPGVLKVLLDPC